MNILTARALEKYIIRLVKRQPKWLQDMFNEDKVAFHVEKNEFSLLIHPDLPEDVKMKIQLTLGKYIDRHPSPILAATELLQ